MTPLDQAYEMGAKGAEPTEKERLLFEAWMRGHCWMLHGDWDGKTYVHEAEKSGYLHPGAMLTRQLWAAWRDRAALAEQPAQQEPEIEYCTDYHCAGDCGRPHNQKEMREFLAAEQPAQQEPEIVQRVKRFAGKTLRTARNPNITARECIELANWLAAHGIKENT